MRSTWIAAAVLAAVGATGVDAKPKRAVRKVPPPSASAAASPMPATPQGMMTPKEVQLRPTSPLENEANAVWSTRAGLNIAALQCQFSPYLATVRNYNDFLRQHADELDRARATMIGHFKRYDGAQAQNSFDRYTTQTYNSYSTLDAQYAFCEAAAHVGDTALTVRKGELGRHAVGLRDHMRASLVPIAAADQIKAGSITPIPLPPIE